jgi:hypothetical protein
MDMFNTNILLAVIIFLLVLKILLDLKIESLEDCIDLIPYIWRTFILILIPFFIIGFIGFILKNTY